MHSVELSDEELEAVQGGYNYVHEGDKYYVYVGPDTDTDHKYACPNCGGPVHYGAGWRFYCDPCDESWFFENDLDINLESGNWKSVTADEYYYRKMTIG